MRYLYTLLVLFSLCAVQGSWAGDARTVIAVSATVLPHASVVATNGAASVTITSADLARGYVDVDRSYRLSSNSARGLLLQLYPRTGLAWRIDVAGLPSLVQIGDTHAEVLRPANEELHLRFRLWLQPLATPGAYPLPVHLAAVAI
jgi:hypothetical protein